MLGKRHVVIAGDNLWSLAKTHLGNGAQWPRIWRYNNRREVVRETGRGIQNPDLIYVGQVLLIPSLPGSVVSLAQGPTAPPLGLVGAQSGQASHAPSAQPLRQQGPLSLQLQNVQSPVSFKFRLDDIKAPPIYTPAAVIESRMTGDVVLMSRKAYPALYLVGGQESRQVEAQVTHEMNHAFGKLIQDSRFIFNPVDRSVTLRSMLVSQSKTPNAPSTAIGVEASSSSPIPKLRAEIGFKMLEGRIDQFTYLAMNVKFVIEITPRAELPGGPSPQPIRIQQLIPVQQPAYDWGRVIGTGLVVGAGVIVVATVVEDFLTVGAGVADDPASFSAAAAAFARGLSMIRGGAALLPQAAAPASVVLGATVQVAH